LPTVFTAAFTSASQSTEVDLPVPEFPVTPHFSYEVLYHS